MELTRIQLTKDVVWKLKQFCAENKLNTYQDGILYLLKNIKKKEE